MNAASQLFPGHQLIESRTQLRFDTELAIRDAGQGELDISRELLSAPHKCIVPIRVPGTQLERDVQYRLVGAASSLQVRVNQAATLVATLDLQGALTATAVIASVAQTFQLTSGTQVLRLPYLGTPNNVCNTISLRLLLAFSQIVGPFEADLAWGGSLAAAEPLFPITIPT